MPRAKRKSGGPEGWNYQRGKLSRRYQEVLLGYFDLGLDEFESEWKRKIDGMPRKVPLARAHAVREDYLARICQPDAAKTRLSERAEKAEEILLTVADLDLPTLKKAVDNQPRAASLNAELSPLKRSLQEAFRQWKALSTEAREAIAVTGAANASFARLSKLDRSFPRDLKIQLGRVKNASGRLGSIESRGKRRSIALSCAVQILQDLFDKHYNGCQSAREIRLDFIEDALASLGYRSPGRQQLQSLLTAAS